MEERARHFGTTVDRASWRLVGLVHCAETTEQAYRDVEFGIEQWFKYFQTVAAFPQMSVTGTTVGEMIAFINSSGLGAIGTPEMCTEQIDRLMKQSNGGFGAYLLLAHEWAKHGACMAQRPEGYFRTVRGLWNGLRWPDFDRLSRTGGLTAGRVREAFSQANRAWEPEHIGLVISERGWLQEMRLCYGRDFRPAPCDARRFGPADSVPLQIWRGL